MLVGVAGEPLAQEGLAHGMAVWPLPACAVISAGGVGFVTSGQTPGCAPAPGVGLVLQT